MTPFQPVSDPLAMPVGALASHDDPIQKGTSIRAAAAAVASAGTHALAVAEGRRLIGLLEEKSLIQALVEGKGHDCAVEEVMDPHPIVLPPHATGAEALRAFDETGCPVIVVADVYSNVVGVLTPSRLLHPTHASYRPQNVGGMATPFGVYLTNGYSVGGASGLPLVASGMVLFTVFFIAIFAVASVAIFLNFDVRSMHVQGWINGLSSLLFLFGLRAIPLAGTHGAEHMVVHAIERGEDLNPEIVRRMPRVHPRCGTNIAVGAMIFMGLFSWEWTPYEEVRTLVSGLVAMIFWQPIGAFVQYWFTTKRPTDAQLEGGIKAGKDLLNASARSPRMKGNVLHRLVSSGLFHVVFGASLAQLAVYGVLKILDLPEQWKVLFFSL